MKSGQRLEWFLNKRQTNRLIRSSSIVNMSKAVRVAATILLASCCMVILCEGAWEEDPSRWEETALSAPRHSDGGYGLNDNTAQHRAVLWALALIHALAGAVNKIEDQQASDQLNIKNQIANTNPIAEEAPNAGEQVCAADWVR